MRDAQKALMSTVEILQSTKSEDIPSTSDSKAPQMGNARPSPKKCKNKGNGCAIEYN